MNSWAERSPVADEGVFNVFSALTETLTAHYAYLATLTSWPPPPAALAKPWTPPR